MYTRETQCTAFFAFWVGKIIDCKQSKNILIHQLVTMEKNCLILVIKMKKVTISSNDFLHLLSEGIVRVCSFLMKSSSVDPYASESCLHYDIHGLIKAILTLVTRITGARHCCPAKLSRMTLICCNAPK